MCIGHVVPSFPAASVTQLGGWRIVQPCAVRTSNARIDAAPSPPCEREGDTRFQCSLERIPPEPEDTGGFEGYAGCIAVIKQVRTVLTIQKQIGKEQSTSLPLSDLSRKEEPSLLGKAEAFARN